MILMIIVTHKVTKLSALLILCKRLLCLGKIFMGKV